jgi:GNAT superfamily N-acetyltransferase
MPTVALVDRDGIVCWIDVHPDHSTRTNPTTCSAPPTPTRSARPRNASCRGDTARESQESGKRAQHIMNTALSTRSPLFCDIALAERIERADAELIALASRASQRRTSTPGFVLPIAGGVASFAEPGSPLNKVAGLGFAGVPSAAELEDVERAYAARGAPTQVELAHLVDPDVAALLSDRGYRLESFENVLGLALDGDQERVTPPGIEVRRSTDDELDAWIAVVADASTHQDTQGLPWHDEFPREAIENAERDFAAAGGIRYAAFRDGVLAGGADFRITDGIAQLAGAATAPAHRRHGVQSALVAARLADAHAAGCDVAVIITQPGSKSQENAQRRGFDLLYTRATLVKH